MDMLPMRTYESPIFRPLFSLYKFTAEDSIVLSTLEERDKAAKEPIQWSDLGAFQTQPDSKWTVSGDQVYKEITNEQQFSNLWIPVLATGNQEWELYSIQYICIMHFFVFYTLCITRQVEMKTVKCLL